MAETTIFGGDDARFQEYQPFAGFPQFPGGPLGGVASMFAQNWLGGQAGQYGYFPGGLTHQNLMDRLEQDRFSRFHQQMVTEAARNDQQSFLRQLQGAATLAGVPWGVEQQRAANNLSNLFVSAAPLLSRAISPDILDAMGGSRGSSMVMADFMARGSRLQIDPATGRMGLGDEATKNLHQSVYNRLFADDNWRGMQLSAGETGRLFYDLQQRGMMPGTAGGAPGGEVNTAGIVKQLQSYQSAISAIREIFGDSGQPNAPMAELINGLNSLSGGAMTQINPTALGRSVRTLQSLATQGGVDMGYVRALSDAVATRAMQTGVRSAFTMQAVEESLSFGNAFMGGGFGAHTAFGRSGLEYHRQLAGQLALSGANSATANQMGLALRLQSMGLLTAGSEGAKYAAALAGGVAPPGQMSDSEFAQMLAASSGRSFGEINTMLFQKSANQSSFHAAGGLSLIRQAQVAELRDFAAQSASISLPSVIGSRLSAEDRARVGAAVSQTLSNMDQATITNTDKRDKAIAARIAASLSMSAEGKKVAESLTDKDLQVAASTIYGELGVNLKAQYGEQFNSTQDFLLQINEPLLRTQRRLKADARIEADIRDSMSSLGLRGSFLRRGIQAVMDADDDDTLADVFIKASGGVDKRAVTESVNKSFKTLRAKKARIDELRNRLSENPEDGAARAELTQAITDMQQAATDISKEFAAQGFDLNAPVTQIDADKALRMDQYIRRNLADGGDPETLSRLAGLEMSASGSFSQGLMNSDSMLLQLGDDGRGALQEVREIDAQLKIMAAQKGVDVGTLLRDDPEARKLRDKKIAALGVLQNKLKGPLRQVDLEDPANKALLDEFKKKASDPELNRMAAAISKATGKPEINADALRAALGDQFVNEILAHPEAVANLEKAASINDADRAKNGGFATLFDLFDAVKNGGDISDMLKDPETLKALQSELFNKPDTAKDEKTIVFNIQNLELKANNDGKAHGAGKGAPQAGAGMA